LPLQLIGLLSQEAMLRLRGRMLSAGGAIKVALGLILILIGLAVACGLDKMIGAELVDGSPMWLTDLTTRTDHASRVHTVTGVHECGPRWPACPLI
jgi:cytochrome c-type biogenesis protein